MDLKRLLWLGLATVPLFLCACESATLVSARTARPALRSSTSSIPRDSVQAAEANGGLMFGSGT